jgi:hypothetical protein
MVDDTTVGLKDGILGKRRCWCLGGQLYTRSNDWCDLDTAKSFLGWRKLNSDSSVKGEHKADVRPRFSSHWVSLPRKLAIAASCRIERLMEVREGISESITLVRSPISSGLSLFHFFSFRFQSDATFEQSHNEATSSNPQKFNSQCY